MKIINIGKLGFCAVDSIKFQKIANILQDYFKKLQSKIFLKHFQPNFFGFEDHQNYTSNIISKWKRLPYQ